LPALGGPDAITVAGTRHRLAGAKP
jgi:hypothetical protein